MHTCAAALAQAQTGVLRTLWQWCGLRAAVPSLLPAAAALPLSACLLQAFSLDDTRWCGRSPTTPGTVSWTALFMSRPQPKASTAAATGQRPTGSCCTIMSGKAPRKGGSCSRCMQHGQRHQHAGGRGNSRAAAAAATRRGAHCQVGSSCADRPGRSVWQLCAVVSMLVCTVAFARRSI